MADPTEVRMAIYFAEGGSHAPEGLGWYIMATYSPDGEGQYFEVIPRVRISPTDATRIAELLDDLANGKPANWSDTFQRSNESLASIVSKLNTYAKRRVGETLAQAQDALRKIEALRVRAAEFDDD